MTSYTRSATLVLGAAALVVILAGCSVSVDDSDAASSSASPSNSAKPSATATAKPSARPSASADETIKPRVATVAGYDTGEFPPVPLFQLPDLSLLDAASASGFTLDVRNDFATIPGVTVTPAYCGDGGEVRSGSGSAYLYGDGSGNYTGSDGSLQNFGDGSGSFTLNGVTVQNFGDGSGNYDDGTVSIQNYGDGSGNYDDGAISVQIYGDGSGNYTTTAGVTINNYGDGSGTYSDGKITINNYGDGSGTYTDGTLTINNYGDGTGAVNDNTIKITPITTVPPLGVFPPLSALQPITSCGTIITFEDGVLFDFDKSDIRSDATTTLKTVAEALVTYDISQAVVSGHTDAIGDDSYNQTLSEQRAQAVVEALKAVTTITDFTAEGYGETRPVAANEVNGQDNPAGRQLNRRVEIFIPAGA